MPLFKITTATDSRASVKGAKLEPDKIMGKQKKLIQLEPVATLIRELCGEHVILDPEMERIYGVPSKPLNEHVRPNADRKERNNETTLEPDSLSAA